VIRRHCGVAFIGVRRMRGGESLRIDLAFGRVDPAVGFELRDTFDVARTDEPVAGGHRGRIVEQRGVAHDARITRSVAHDDVEVAARATTE
jgi:hypothetical protein